MGTARIYFRRNCRTRSRPRTRQLRTTLGRHRTSLHHFEVETLARLQLPESAEKGFWRLCPLRPLCAVCAKSIAQPSYGTSTVAVRPARQPQQQRLRPLPEERAYVYVRSCTCRSSERPPAQRFCCRNPLRGRPMHPRCGALTAWRRVRACTARASASPFKRRVSRREAGALFRPALRCLAPPRAAALHIERALNARLPQHMRSRGSPVPFRARGAAGRGGNGGILFGFRASQPADAPKHGPQHQLHAAASGGGAPARVHHRTPRLCTGKQARPAAAGGSR